MSGNQAKGLIAFWVVFLAPLCSPAAAGIVVEAGACQQQVQDWLRLEVDCAVHVRFDTADAGSLPAWLLPLAQSAGCTIPLRFAKRDVYGAWISATIVDPPAIAADCLLAPPNGEAAQFHIVVDPRCEKADGHWSCQPGLRETTGLGVIGAMLENFVNHDPALLSTINRALDAAAGQ